MILSVSFLSKIYIYREHVRDELLVAMGRLLDKRGGEIRRKEREIPQGRYCVL